jgi:hypothetical protein
MSIAACLLEELAGIGAKVEPAGTNLILRAGLQPIPPQLVRRVRDAKTDLIAILRTNENQIVRWLDDHPAPSPAGRCAWCSQAEGSQAVVLPFGTEPGTHTWLHAQCWRPWHEARRAAAISVLGEGDRE